MDARDLLLMTPLHWAVERGNVNSIEVSSLFGNPIPARVLENQDMLRGGGEST